MTRWEFKLIPVAGYMIYKNLITSLKIS